MDRKVIMESKEPLALEEAFQAFSRFGFSKKNRDGLSLFNLDKWLRQAQVVGKDVSSTTAAIIFKQLSKKRSLTIEEFRVFLEKFAAARCTSVPSLVDLLVKCGAPRHNRMSIHTEDKGNFPKGKELPGSSRVMNHRYQSSQVYRKYMARRGDCKEDKEKINCAIITEEVGKNTKNIKINFASYHFKGGCMSPLSITKVGRRERSSKAKSQSAPEILPQITSKEQNSVEVDSTGKNPENSKNSYIIIKHPHPSNLQDLMKFVNFGIAPGIKLRTAENKQQKSSSSDISIAAQKIMTRIVNRKTSGRESSSSRESLKENVKRRLYLSPGRRLKRSYKARSTTTESHDVKPRSILCKSDLSLKECALLRKEKKEILHLKVKSEKEKSDTEHGRKTTAMYATTITTAATAARLNPALKPSNPMRSDKACSPMNGQPPYPPRKNLKVQFAEPIVSIV